MTNSTSREQLPSQAEGERDEEYAEQTPNRRGLCPGSAEGERDDELGHDQSCGISSRPHPHPFRRRGKKESRRNEE